MSVGEFLPPHDALGQLMGELERNGCRLSIVNGPTATGQLVLRVLFPENEYLEKRCRLLLDRGRVA
jgi:hypothetical protein